MACILLIFCFRRNLGETEGEEEERRGMVTPEDCLSKACWTAWKLMSEESSPGCWQQLQDTKPLLPALVTG